VSSISRDVRTLHKGTESQESVARHSLRDLR